MLGSYSYWITTAALVLCLFVSLMRRQTVRQLVEARQKLLDERAQREQLLAELVHVRSVADKDLAASKKQATDANDARTELEVEKSKLAQERDALRAELGDARATLDARIVAEEAAKKTIAELEERLESGRTGAQANADKLGDLGREVQAARAKIEAFEKKIEAETRLRKTAEDDRNAAKATLTTLEAKLREVERTKTLQAETFAKEAQGLRVASAALEADLVRTKEQLSKADEELAAERSKVQTPASSASAGGGDLLAALDADPFLNRGQKETIRGTYNQFTAKRRSS